jgi:hypothetical protein
MRQIHIDQTKIPKMYRYWIFKLPYMHNIVLPKQTRQQSHKQPIQLQYITYIWQI